MNTPYGEYDLEEKELFVLFIARSIQEGGWKDDKIGRTAGFKTTAVILNQYQELNQLAPPSSDKRDRLGDRVADWKMLRCIGLLQAIINDMTTRREYTKITTEQIQEAIPYAFPDKIKAIHKLYDVDVSRKGRRRKTEKKQVAVPEVRRTPQRLASRGLPRSVETPPNASFHLQALERTTPPDFYFDEPPPSPVRSPWPGQRSAATNRDTPSTPQLKENAMLAAAGLQEVGVDSEFLDRFSKKGLRLLHDRMRNVNNNHTLLYNAHLEQGRAHFEQGKDLREKARRDQALTMLLTVRESEMEDQEEELASLVATVVAPRLSAASEVDHKPSAVPLGVDRKPTPKCLPSKPAGIDGASPLSDITSDSPPSDPAVAKNKSPPSENSESMPPTKKSKSWFGGYF